MSFSPSDERAVASALHAHLYEVLDQDPAKAILEARALRARPDLLEANINAIRAAIFIDAGAQIGNASVVEDGVRLLRRLDAADDPNWAYNLGNGLAALVTLTSKGSAGELDSAGLRQEARSLFKYAADRATTASVRSASLTNQANLLRKSYRWVEAYDAYAAALQHDSANAVALSGISSLLRWRMRSHVDKPGPLRRVAVRYLLRAYRNQLRGHSYAGPGGVKRIQELMQEFQVTEKNRAPRAERPPGTPFAGFVRRHRLALCLEPEGVGKKAGRWDHLAIPFVTEPVTSDSRIPSIFALWNVLKSDFLTARWLAYTAIAADFPVPDTGFYSDTLDYANYGMRCSTLVLAQKAACDVLDKVAVAATEYLHLPGRRAYFGTRWHAMDSKRSKDFASPLRWQPEIEAEIETGNAGLVALSELAYDYARGHLHSKKKARNTATHGVVVLHDMLTEAHSRPCASIERHRQSDYEREAVESLQIARAALMYLREIVVTREARFHKSGGGVAVPMLVPSHHWIRGEDSANANRHAVRRLKRKR